MTLCVEIADGPAEGATRILSAGGALRLAARPPADGAAAWVLPGAEGDGECLLRDVGGQVRVTAAAGEVRADGATLAEGQDAVLSPGGTFSVAGRAIRLRHAETAPAGASISAILADVTPGGEAATGPLPGRTGEDFLSGLTGAQRIPSPAPPPTPFAAATAPSPLPGGPGTVLPDDWLSEPSREDAGGSDRIEQIAADRVPVDLSPADPVAIAPEPDDRLDRAVRDLARAAGMRAAPEDVPAETQIANAGAALRDLIATISAMEATCEALFAELDLSDPGRTPGGAPVLDAAAILGDRTGQVAIALSTRLDAIRAAQDAVLDVSVAQLVTAGDALDPDAIEADMRRRGGWLARVSPARARWRSYLSRIAPAGKDGPLSLAALRVSLRNRLSNGLPPSEDESEDTT